MMLTSSEFTVGCVSKATPLTLVLPRNTQEEPFLIGLCSNAPAALFLSGRHQFTWFASAGSETWNGLLIPNVRIEVDETSIFCPSDVHPEFGTIVRKDAQLVAQARARSTHSVNRAESVVLEDGLPSTLNVEAGFRRWQIVLGSGLDKRVMYEVSVKRT